MFGTPTSEINLAIEFVPNCVVGTVCNVVITRLFPSFLISGEISLSTE